MQVRGEATAIGNILSQNVGRRNLCRLKRSKKLCC